MGVPGSEGLREFLVGVLTESPLEHLATLHYHFLITIQAQPAPNRFLFRTHSGIFQWEPGITRIEAFSQILNWTLERYGLRAGEAALLFFDLSPNVF